MGEVVASSWCRIQWVSFDVSLQALPIIESLLEDGKVPVICGGTNYYIESLLWKILVDHEPPPELITEVTDDGEESDLADLSNQELYQRLTEVGRE